MEFTLSVSQRRTQSFTITIIDPNGDFVKDPFLAEEIINKVDNAYGLQTLEYGETMIKYKENIYTIHTVSSDEYYDSEEFDLI